MWGESSWTVVRRTATGLITLEMGNGPTNFWCQLPGIHTERKVTCGQPDTLSWGITGLECDISWRTAGSGRRSGEGQSEPASRCVDISE